MLKLAKYLKKYRLQTIVGPIFKLTEAIFELIVPIIMAMIIDNGVHNKDSSYVLGMGGILVLLGMVGLACAMICQSMASVASQGFGTELRDAMFKHINTLAYSDIDKFGAPTLITRVTNDVNQLQVAVAMLIRLVIRAPFLVIGATAMSFIIDWQLALVVLAATPLIVLCLYFIMGRSIPYFKQTRKKLDKISLITRENLSGARVIRAFSRQESEKERFDASNEDFARTSVRVGKITTLLSPLTFIVANVAIIAILWFGGGRVELGGMTQGEIIAFVNYMTQINLALAVVANLVVIFTRAAASAARVNEILDTVPAMDAPETMTEQENTDAPRLAFEGVSFAYPGASGEILRDICFDMGKGETVGVIGGTGAGKSTLAALASRFYDTTKGTVRLDGVDIRKYPAELLRRKIAVTPQKALLFSGAISDNLRLGAPDATNDELWQALRTAQAEDFVRELPNGLESRVEQGGRNFSGGQRQRLTIARALAAKPELLILDDSASALDFATDARLRQAIKSETKGMSVIIISQRVGTVRGSDRIAVMDDGRLAGIGTHEELLETCGIYREICASQLSGEELRG